MKKLACRNFGFKSDFIATGNSDEELIQTTLRYVQAKHPKELFYMMGRISLDQMKQVMAGNIEEV